MDICFTPLIHVYIDESGNPMPGKNDSDFYICTAVVVSDSDVQDVEKGLALINQKYRNGATLKSSAVGARHELRLAILQDLFKLKFSYLFLITDKTKFIPNTPLEKYKKTRYKFLHNRLNQLLEENNCNLDVIIDKHGTPEFQAECLKYYTKHSSGLFGGEVHHSYADDEEVTPLQIADFIGGTLMFCFDPKKKSDFSQKFRNIMITKEIKYDFFPRGCFETIPLPVPDNKLAEELYRHLYNKAVTLLDQLETSNSPDEQMQYQTLNTLFLARCYEEPLKQWIYSDEIYKDLRKQGFDISKRTFTVKIIGGLRRKKIIIAGSPNGYKLALTLADIKEYLQHDNNIIFPMLEKLKMAKGEVMFLIGHNILQEEYSRFDTILNALTDSQLHQYTDEPNIEKIQMVSDEEEN